ncbi:DUF294 nucleotidyltransferase-like domain-containing protein [Pelagibaculum spongiae]|uniref:Cyclic nucleotide-binding domain-containing protein n=1 Tax=Pelagibaculum spongiae TaxID=2080658 RepID=A0A2V1GX26_9GAMM|nr:DUF294 nucleotidyltransferase-like domain-containing protein [Pelagibaculum spongiae]PVZ69618.1 hypothetical protein DC094_09945 [Pelagibaculum spongiae]
MSQNKTPPDSKQPNLLNQRFHQPPFDCLTESQRHQLEHATSISWFKPGEKLIRAGTAPASLMVVQKGIIEERSPTDPKKIYAHYAEEDLFDVRGLLEKNARHEYICLEEALIHEIPAELFLTLCKQNTEFQQNFQANLGDKQQQLNQQERTSNQPNMADFLLSRITAEHCKPALTVSGLTSLSECARLIEDKNLDALLIDLNPQLGMITRTDLLKALAIKQLPLTANVAPVAITPLISVAVGGYLFDALLLMTQKRIERVAVFDGSQLVGMLDLTAILSLASSHSHLMAMRIARANDLSELIELSPEIEQQVRSLFSNGVRTGFVMKLASTLNRQLIKRLFELHFPKEYHSQVCLLALGSEGRSEQVLKTDQDNALIFDDDFPRPPQQLLEGFSELLMACGWPRCPGNIMVSNPHWVFSQKELKKRIIGWMDNSNPQRMMEMAMMADADCLAGNSKLLDGFYGELNSQLGRRQSFLAGFVAPALHFETPLTFFGRLKEGADHKIDIKKAGIFPLVHGIRALALEQRIRARSSTDRLDTLNTKDKIDPNQASKLEEAFLVLNRLRLEQQIAGDCDGNKLDLSKLDYRRRDMLRLCLHTVKKFRQFLHHHFHLETL